MRRSIYILTQALLLLFLKLQFLYPNIAQGFTINPPGFVKDPGKAGIGETINFIVTVLAIIGVVASIIWLLYGGIKYITAGGDKAAIEGAKTHIVSALVGLIIVLFTFVIISMVFTLLGLPGSWQTFTIPNL